MKLALSWLLWLICGALMLVGVVLALPRWIVMNADRLWMRHVYYRAVRIRRWTFDAEPWQEHDLRIGVTPPPGHPWWAEQAARGVPVIMGGEPPDVV